MGNSSESFSETLAHGNRKNERRQRHTDEDGKKTREYGKTEASTKERSPDSLSLPNQNIILIIIKWYYFKRYEKNRMKFN